MSVLGGVLQGTVVLAVCVTGELNGDVTCVTEVSGGPLAYGTIEVAGVGGQRSQMTGLREGRLFFVSVRLMGSVGSLLAVEERRGVTERGFGAVEDPSVCRENSVILIQESGKDLPLRANSRTCRASSWLKYREVISAIVGHT